MEIVRKKDRCELKVTQNTNIKGVVDRNDKLSGKGDNCSLKKSKVPKSKSFVRLEKNIPLSVVDKRNEVVFRSSCGTQTEVTMVPKTYTEEQKLLDMFSTEISTNYLLNQIDLLEESYNSLLEESFSLDITISELNESIAEVKKDMELTASVFNEAVLDEEGSEADQE